MSRKIVLTFVLICAFLLIALVLFFGISSNSVPAPSVPNKINIKKETILPTTERFTQNFVDIDSSNKQVERWDWHLVSTSKTISFTYTFPHENIKKEKISLKDDWDSDYLKVSLDTTTRKIKFEIEDITKIKTTLLFTFILDENPEVKLVIAIYGLI